MVLTMNPFVLDALKFVSSTFMLEAYVESDISEELPFQLRNKATLCIVRLESRDFVLIAVEEPAVLQSNNALHVRRVAERYNLALIIVTSRERLALIELAKQLHGGLVVPGRYAVECGCQVANCNE